MLDRLDQITNPDHVEYEEYIDYHCHLATKAIDNALQRLLPATAWPAATTSHPGYRNIPEALFSVKSLAEAAEFLTDLASQGRAERWGTVDADFQLGINRHLLLQEIDRAWANQGTDLTNLMQVVSLRSGKNPVGEYITEASNGFEDMKLDVAFGYATMMAKTKVNAKSPTQDHSSESSL